MPDLPAYFDIVDGKWRLRGYEELSFSTEADAQSAAELALYYFIDRHSREMQQEQRYRRAEQRAKA